MPAWCNLWVAKNRFTLHLTHYETCGQGWGKVQAASPRHFAQCTRIVPILWGFSPITEFIMAVEQRHADDEPELSLADFLRELWAKKFLLLSLSAIAAVVAAVVSLTIPNIYQASSALIVRPPRNANPTAEEAPVISVETLQTLTQSSETLWLLFESLWSRRALPEWAENEPDMNEAFINFQRMVTTELQETQTRERGDAVELLPILVLRVSAHEPETAALVANEWAGIVEAKAREIYTESVNTLDDYVSDMYDSSNEALLMAESGLAEKKIQALIDIKTLRLEALKKQIATLEEAVLGIDVDISVNEAAILDGKERLARQFPRDEWLGSEVENALMTGQELPVEYETLNERSKIIVDLVRQKVDQAQALREYKRDKNVTEKRKLMEHYQDYSGELLQQIALHEDRLPALEQMLASLTESISGMSETVTLDKAISDDPLWEAFLNDQANPEAVQTPLKTQEINPSYQATEQEIITTTAEIAEAKSSIEHLTAQQAENGEKMRQLEIELDQLSQEVERRESAIGATEKSLDLLRNEAFGERNNIATLSTMNLRLAKEREAREGMRQQFVQEAADLEEEITRTNLELDVLQRDVEQSESVRAALATKSESTALLRVAVESAARTGTAILYNAQANPFKVGPKRSVMVFASAAGTFVLCAAIICMGKILREST